MISERQLKVDNRESSGLPCATQYAFIGICLSSNLFVSFCLSIKRFNDILRLFVSGFRPGERSEETLLRTFARLSTLFAMLLACTAAAWSATNSFYGGFEDTVAGDYDYNDNIFKISANNLKLNSAGTLNSAPVLGTSGSPFWNNGSFDGPGGKNVGYRIYGGGAFGTGLDPDARYLAGPSGESLNDVSFSVGPVASSAGVSIDASIDLKVSAHDNAIGFYYLTSPGAITWLPTVAGSSYSFLDVGGKAFGIAAQDLNTGMTFYSDTLGGTLGTTDSGVNHIAWFSEAPEPTTWACMGIGLVLAGVLARRNRSVLAN